MSTLHYWIAAGLVGVLTLVAIAKPRGEKKPKPVSDDWAGGIGTAIAVLINVYILILLVHAARALP